MILCPQKIKVSGSREHPCAIAVQYLLREGRLNAITFMRSQSAALVMPYDVFLFMSLQCALSQRLGVALGTYVHVSGSFHYYADESETVRKIVEEEITTLGLRDILGTSLSFDKFRSFERKVRLACTGGDVSTLDLLAEEAKLGLPGVESGNLLLLIHAFQRLSMVQRSRELAIRLKDPLRSLVLDSLLRGDI